MSVDEAGQEATVRGVPRDLAQPAGVLATDVDDFVVGCLRRPERNTSNAEHAGAP